MARVLGIDLGAYSVKMVVATPGFRQASVVDFFERPIPHGDEPFEERAARVVGLLVREHRLEHDTPYAAISGDQVFIHILDFPFKNLRRQELEKAVGTELEGLLPVDLEDMVFDFGQLPKGPDAPAEVVAPNPDPAFAGDDDPTIQREAAPFGMTARGPVAPATEGMRVLACAARLDRARQLVTELERRGSGARGLIAAPAAYARLAERIAECETAKSDGQCVAIVDMGHLRTDVCVVMDGRVDYARTISRGGHHLTEAIVRSFTDIGLSYEDAERAKHQDGFIASTKRPPPSEKWARVHEVMYQELGPLARDLRRTLMACRAKTGATVERMVLVGGASRLNGMVEFLSEELGMPVSILTPEDGRQILGEQVASLGTQADVACLAAGVAFEGATGRPAFDLRQGELAYKADLSFLSAKWPQLAAAVLVVLIFAAGSAFARQHKLRKAERVLDDRLAQESKRAFGSEKDADEVLQKISPSEGPTSPIPKITAYDLLLAFNESMPDKKKVALDIREINVKLDKIQIRKAISTPKDELSAVDGIHALQDKLKKSECFKEFSDADSKLGKEKTREFSMTLNVGC